MFENLSKICFLSQRESTILVLTKYTKIILIIIGDSFKTVLSSVRLQLIWSQDWMKVFIALQTKEHPFVLRHVNCWNKKLQGTVWYGEDYGGRIINGLGRFLSGPETNTSFSMTHRRHWNVVSPLVYPPGGYLAWSVAYFRWIDLPMDVN